MHLCPKCKTYIYHDVLVCPECGHNLLRPSSQKPRKSITIGAGVAVAAAIIAALFVTNTIEFQQNQISPVSSPEPSQKIMPQSQVESGTSKSSTITEFALTKINNERNGAGVQPLLLSDNIAAQILAGEILQTKTSSHWLKNGEKPYMTYSRLGGTGYVQQNIATLFCEDDCTLDLFGKIESLQMQMVHEDEEYDWQRLVNTLDKHHTHVSLGISYDADMVVLVQNFENNYIDFAKPLPQNEKQIQILGTMKKGSLSRIDVYYDQLPSESLYEEHKNDLSYDLGRLVAVIENPSKEKSIAESLGVEPILPSIWPKSGSKLVVEFDLSNLATESGVYTIGVWLEENGEQFLATSHSVFIQ